MPLEDFEPAVRALFRAPKRSVYLKAEAGEAAPEPLAG